MKYLPWDRLQLDASIDGGWRVTKQKILFDVFRTYKRKLRWGPLYLKNGALFHGGNIDHKLTFIETLVSQNEKVKDSSTIALFDFNNNLINFAEKLEQENEGFEYHPYEESIEKFLTDLVEFRSIIQNANKGSGYIEPPNRKVLIVLIDLDKERASQIQANPRLRALFKSLIQDSERERIYVIPLMSFSDEMPVGVLPILEWIVYLGERNMLHAKKQHSDLTEGYYSFAQQHIGSHFSQHEKRLMAVHPLKFSPSEWFIAEQKKLNDEDAAYEEFLNALDDGSESDDKEL